MNNKTINIKKSKIVDCTNKGATDLQSYLQKNGKTIDDFNFNNISNKKHVALIGAGMSAERLVSLSSASGIANSLIELGYQVTFIDMGRDVAQVLYHLSPDIVYNSLHGTYGEDGCLAGLLNIMRIPYTGCGVMPSAIAFNKKESHQLFQTSGIKMADAQYVKKSDKIKIDPIARPYVIKPLTQGSSVGIEIIFKEDDFCFAEYEFPYGEILVEKYIKGRELQVAVLNGKALGVLEIELLQGKRFFDYEAKYTEGFTKHLTPAPVDKSTYQKALEISEYACRILNCTSGIIRVEFIYQEEENKLYILEINTHPGMTPMSICPEIAALKNINYTNLVLEIVKGAKFEA